MRFPENVILQNKFCPDNKHYLALGVICEIFTRGTFVLVVNMLVRQTSPKGLGGWSGSNSLHLVPSALSSVSSVIRWVF